MKELCAVAVKLPTPNAALIRAFRDSLTLERPTQIGQNESKRIKAAVCGGNSKSAKYDVISYRRYSGKIVLLRKRQLHVGNEVPFEEE